MKRDMNNKERRKIVVRGKKKTYTRTMLVKTAQDIGRRESLHQIKLEQANHQPSTMSKLLAKAKSGIRGVLPNRNVGALHSLHPWQEHHTGTRGSGDSGYRDRKADPGVPSPGSDHSLFAHLVGTMRDESKPRFDVPNENARLLRAHARSRRATGVSAGMEAQTGRYARPGSPNADDFDFYRHDPWRTAAHMGGISGSLMRRYGRDNVTRVPQNPNRWVR